MKAQFPEPMDYNKGNAEGNVYRHEWKNTVRSQINDLMLHLKLLQKQGQAKSKTSGRR
jgi:hypothetical protein